MKRISAQAYQALRDALSLVTWNKSAFESILSDALRDRPELLVGLDFDGVSKRETADVLVDRLAANEATYQPTTVELMLDIASMTRFTNIERIKDASERAAWLQRAEDAVGALRVLVAPYRDHVAARDNATAARQSHTAGQAALRRFSDELDLLRERYVAMHSADDPHARGKAFEVLLWDMFLLFDMEPRLSYDLPHEQIDGSLSFDTDDYVVEARWRKEPTGRGDLDVFKAKVERKGRNALGLFVNVNNFSSDALAQYASASPFVVFTAEHVYIVLEGRLRLDEVLRAKKRHVNETDDCHLAARSLLV